MKNLFLLFTFFFFASSCGEEKQPEQQENSIYGTWQLVEQWLGNVGDTSVNWSEISDGHTMSLSNDNSFKSTEFTVCQNSVNIGNFSLSEELKVNLIEISFFCSSTEIKLIRTYVYSYESGFLILSPFSNPCAEGCLYKFKKISSEE